MTFAHEKLITNTTESLRPHGQQNTSTRSNSVVQ